MISVKKRIKEKIPPYFLDVYDIVKLLPRYLRAEIKEKTVGMSVVSFYTDGETVDQIINQGLSLSRFGDGEFRWMLGIKEQSFQQCSNQLAQALIDAFKNNHEKLMIGIPRGMFDSVGCKLFTKMWWRIVKWETFSQLTPYMDYKRIYCNASITRPYIDYIDEEYSRMCFENVRRIWNGRDCIFVEGEKTMLGVGNDLFDNANSIARIVCPAENAFEKIEQIKNAIERYAKKDTLLLGALGPTASILAVQMCEKGYQFVDIGHIDIEYMWFLQHTKRRVPVVGKYVNECGGQPESEAYRNPDYLNSILTVIC